VYAEKRALVIGINAYVEVPPLEKAVGDANAVAAALKGIGFTVTLVTDIARRELNERITEFQKTLTTGDIALVYYSGHGVEIDGQNYLLPADIPEPHQALDDTDDDAAPKADAASKGGGDYIKGEAIGLVSLIERLDAGIRILIIDACRDNPFAAGGTKGVGRERGLARVEGPEGTFILYSAGYGQAALDRLGDTDPEPTSVFTRVLLKHIPTNGQKITDLAKEVRREVQKLALTVGHEQRPAYYDELTDDFYLNPPAPPPPSPPSPSDTLVHCDGVVASVGPSLRCLRPGDTFQDCEKCPEMVMVPKGQFEMGSQNADNERFPDEGPQHLVKIETPFAVSRSEVTVEELTVFVKESGYSNGDFCSGWTGKKWEKAIPGNSWRRPGFEQEGNHPAVCLSWHDAKAYVEWLSKTTQRQYRLLSEAEWEYAARANSKTRYYFGDDENEICDYANGSDQTLKGVHPRFPQDAAVCSDRYIYTAPVGKFEANDFGLKDMHGNVWEWVEDCYRDSYDGASSGGPAVVTEDCSLRVLRGGAWNYPPRSLRSSNRGNAAADSRSSGFGLRVARVLVPDREALMRP
jgi:formylglycine-generating enzyme required for sulfatase activity